MSIVNWESQRGEWPHR